MNLSQILLWILVFVVIVWFFESMLKHSPKERFEEAKQYQVRPHIGVSPVMPEIPTIPREFGCDVIKENDLKTEYYVEKRLSGKDYERCPQDVKSIKQFNKDFFNFRDKYTYENSSMRPDAVDKVINLQLSGSLSKARGTSGRKITDIYDEVTGCGPNLYERTCVRAPYFDNTMHDGYLGFDSNMINGMHLIRDTWKYANENSMNGGELDKNLYGQDLEQLQQFPYLGKQ